MDLNEFDYNLPASNIAQHPVVPRDACRLMIVDRKNQTITHKSFMNLGDFLNRGDLLVANNSRVVPSRIEGQTLESGNKFEILLLKRLSGGLWESLIKPGRKFKKGSKFSLSRGDFRLEFRVIEELGNGSKIVHIDNEEHLTSIATIALPPYIKDISTHDSDYQTIFAKSDGSIAAPTAGLHFTQKLLLSLKKKGIDRTNITLHVGWDSFRPIRSNNIDKHIMHSENYSISKDTLAKLYSIKKDKKRIVAVGTTTTRVLEHLGQYNDGRLINVEKIGVGTGKTNLFIRPGHDFKIVDVMITNFHLPKSTLLLLVSAFANKELILYAYNEAVKEGYRFYSFGDAMLII